VLEYARPPVLSQLKLQMLAIVVLPLMWLLSPVRRWSPTLTLQTLFVLWCAKSIPFAYNYYSVYFTTRGMYGNVVIALMIVWLVVSLRDLRRLLWLWLVLMSYQAVWSLLHNGKGTGGFLGDENDLALACGTAVPLAIAGFERLRGRTRWILLGAGVLLVGAVVYGFSRGGFVGLVAATGYLVYASRHRVRSLALIAAAGLLLYAVVPQSYIDEMATIQQTDEGTAKGRRFLWAAAWNMFLDNPVMGVGASNSAFLVGRYQATDFEGREYNERDWSGTVIHSMWYTMVAEQGAPGTLLFLAVMGRQFLVVYRLRRDVHASRGASDDLARQVDCFGIGLNGATMAFCASGTFLTVNYYPYFWYFAAFADALNWAARRELAEAEASAAPPSAAT
jgi:O-antigen ligase